MDQSGPGGPPPSGREPPQQGWQSTPQQPGPPPPPPPAGPPPMGPPGGMGAGTPAWVGNLTSTAPVAGPAGYFYADVPNRFIAYIIDIIIIAVADIIVSIVVSAVLGGVINANLLSPGFGSVNNGSLFIIAILGLAVNAGYFIYMWVAMRGTVGMKVLGMQIWRRDRWRDTDLSASGHPLAVARCAVRAGPVVRRTRGPAGHPGSRCSAWCG